MTVPASTQVLNEVQARLERIKVQSGFSIDVQIVERSKKTRFTFTELPGINFYASEDTITKDFGSENHSLSVSIEFVDRTMAQPFNDLAADRAADIVKALAENDAGISMNLGGLVDTVVINRVTPVVDKKDTPYCGVIVDIAIKYKTASFNPYTII